MLANGGLFFFCAQIPPSYFPEGRPPFPASRADTASVKRALGRESTTEHRSESCRHASETAGGGARLVRHAQTQFLTWLMEPPANEPHSPQASHSPHTKLSTWHLLPPFVHYENRRLRHGEPPTPIWLQKNGDPPPHPHPPMQIFMESIRSRSLISSFQSILLH